MFDLPVRALKVLEYLGIEDGDKLKLAHLQLPEVGTIVGPISIFFEPLVISKRVYQEIKAYQDEILDELNADLYQHFEMS